MKIFQIMHGFLHWDATNTVKTLESAAEMFSPDLEFVEAPDYVFEGWGYNPALDGDARFLKPEPPAGWEYDDATGTYYPVGSVPQSAEKSAAELTRENEALKQTVTDLELALCEMYEALISVTGG